MVALSRDYVAQGVPEVEFRVCKNGLDGGGFEVGVVDLVLKKRVLVCVKRQHLHAVPLRQQPGGQAVHRNAAPIHSGAGRLVTNLKDAKGGTHLDREIRTNPILESTDVLSLCSTSEMPPKEAGSWCSTTCRTKGRGFPL